MPEDHRIGQRRTYRRAKSSAYIPCDTQRIYLAIQCWVVAGEIEFEWDDENRTPVGLRNGSLLSAAWTIRNSKLRAITAFSATVSDGRLFWRDPHEEADGAKLRERIAASKKAPTPVVALRIPEADLALARKQAEQKGLPYQTYIKSLLHETLIEREKRKVGGDGP